MSKIKKIGETINAKTMLAMAMDQASMDDRVMIILIRKEKNPQLWVSSMTPEQEAYCAMLVQHHWLEAVHSMHVDPEDDDHGA